MRARSQMPHKTRVRHKKRHRSRTENKFKRVRQGLGTCESREGRFRGSAYEQKEFCGVVQGGPGLSRGFQEGVQGGSRGVQRLGAFGTKKQTKKPEKRFGAAWLFLWRRFQ